MRLNKKTHARIRLRNSLVTVAFLLGIGLAAWCSTRYGFQMDWTAGGRNTLSGASRALLDRLDQPITITAYASEDKVLRGNIRDTVGRYQRYKSDIELRFIHSSTRPEQTRQLGIARDGELLIEYRERSEKLEGISESELTNALQRLASPRERWLCFLSGHGERAARGEANHDLGQFGAELLRKGFKLQPLNLASTPAIPDNISVLVISAPEVALLPGEVRMIEDYLDRGGNLLWLSEPDSRDNLPSIAEKIGVDFLSGVVVDASTRAYGINDPSFALIPEYPYHPITRNFRAISLFPAALALEADPDSAYQATPLLSTLPRSWTETGPLEGRVRFEPERGEHQGPLDIALALTRVVEAETREQRIVVTGDGDFLSNAYLGNGGNLDLGLNIIQWLSHSDALINIPAKTAPDRTLELSTWQTALIGFGFLAVIPLLLAGTGSWIWFKRRRR